MQWNIDHWAAPGFRYHRITTHVPGRIKDDVISSVEESLKRLQRECIDLIQMHNHVAPEAEDGSVTPEERKTEMVPS